MIPKEYLESVSSRADVLSRRYYFLEKDDLMQEGYILLMDLEKKDLTPLQKHKAINNHFSNLERHAQNQQKTEKNSSSFPIEPDISHDVEDISEVTERNEITKALLGRLSRQEVVVVEWLSQGLTIDQISTALGVSRNRTRGIINHIIDIRKEIEDD
jgi:DNA-directed RNA polymerase specialized sigma24 family protein